MLMLILKNFSTIKKIVIETENSEASWIISCTFQCFLSMIFSQNLPKKYLQRPLNVFAT
jgi:hypothetical protein